MAARNSVKIRMLVVDDDSEIAHSVEQLLVKKFEATVEIAGDASEARGRLLTHPFDIVILDYQLPDGNGLELLKEIAEKKNHPPVIMVTGQGDEAIASEAFRLRASGYVVKDNRLPSMLPEAVGSVLNEIALRRAEEKLQRSEENERALLNATQESLMLLDKEGKILATNETQAGRLGMTAAEAVGENYFESIPADLSSVRKKRMAEVLQTGRPSHFGDKRKELYLDVVMYPVFNEEGSVERVALFAQDVTERKTAEEALKKARDELEERVRERTDEILRTNKELRAEITVRQKVEESLKTLSAQVHSQARMLDQILSSSPDMFYLYDNKGRHLYASGPAAKLLGLKQSDVEGRYWWDLLLPEESMRPLDIQRESVITTGEERSGLVRLPTSDGEKDFEYILSPIIGWDGKVSAVLATVREATKEGVTIGELERRASEFEEMTRLLDMMPFALIIRDMDGRIAYWSRGAERMYGWTRDEALGRVAGELLETEFPKPPGEINFDLVTNGSWEGYLVKTARDDSAFTVHSKWTVELDETGRPLSILEIDEPPAVE